MITLKLTSPEKSFSVTVTWVKKSTTFYSCIKDKKRAKVKIIKIKKIKHQQ